MQDDSHRELVNALLRCIRVDEEFAQEIAVIANQFDLNGNYAAAIRNMSRNHLIRGMEGRAQIAALSCQGDDGSGGEQERRG